MFRILKYSYFHYDANFIMLLFSIISMIHSLESNTLHTSLLIYQYIDYNKM